MKLWSLDLQMTRLNHPRRRNGGDSGCLPYLFGDQCVNFLISVTDRETEFHM